MVYMYTSSWERERERDSKRVREREKEKERTLTRRVRFEKNFETRFADSQIPSSIPYSVVSTSSLILILLYQCYISGTLREDIWQFCQMSSLKGTNDFFLVSFLIDLIDGWRLTERRVVRAQYTISSRKCVRFSLQIIPMCYLLVEYVYYCCINAKLRSRRIAVSSPGSLISFWWYRKWKVWRVVGNTGIWHQHSRLSVVSQRLTRWCQKNDHFVVVVGEQASQAVQSQS